MSTPGSRSDFLAYHQSLAAELKAIKDRVRSLISHWPTDGGFKEAALRSILRRHLPETLQIGTGFIVCSDGRVSTQIDLLIADRARPTIFKDGDLMIVTPSAVRGIIEVKTTLSGPQQIKEALGKLDDCMSLCQDGPSWGSFFTGLFVYEGAEHQSRHLIEAVKDIDLLRRRNFHAVAHGPDVICLFYEHGQLPDGTELIQTHCVWTVPSLAPALFLSSIVNKLCKDEIRFSTDAWFPDQPNNAPLFYIDSQTTEIREWRPNNVHG